MFNVFSENSTSKNFCDKLQVMLRSDDSNCWLIVFETEHDYQSVNKTYWTPTQFNKIK